MSVPRASRSTSNSIDKPSVKRMAIPAYRLRNGYDQAIVTLTDSASGKRRDYWLGTHGTPESRELYHRLLADWETNGRRLPDRPSEAATPTGTRIGTTVAQLVSQYWKWAKEYYTESSAYGVRAALRVLRECHGSTDAGSFGPNALRVVRDAMVLGKAEGKHRRPPWCRKTINTRVADIIRMFKWAASRELVGAEVYQALNTLAPLKRGRCAAPDHEPIRPVPMELVEAVKPHVSRQVRALIELQLLCGARPGELLTLRASDIDTGGHVAHGGGKGGVLGVVGTVWVYRPTQHKNVHRGKDRSIYFGPQAQKILAEFMADRPVNEYLFSPADADLERRAVRNAKRITPLSCGNVSGESLKDDPKWRAGEFYTTASYRRAIERACDKAFVPPEHLRPRKVAGGRLENDLQLAARLTPRQRAELKAWREEHRWHPNQLRHTAATLIRKEFGLEAAQLVLGHSSASITDAVYAERDTGKIADVIRKVG